MATGEKKSEPASTAASAKPRLSANHEDLSIESFQKDLAAGIVSDQAQEFDAATEQRVIRKIDLYLIPWMWFGYGLVYYDKVCIRHISLACSLCTHLQYIGHFGKCSPLRNDEGSFLKRG